MSGRERDGGGFGLPGQRVELRSTGQPGAAVPTSAPAAASVAAVELEPERYELLLALRIALSWGGGSFLSFWARASWWFLF